MVGGLHGDDAGHHCRGYCTRRGHATTRFAPGSVNVRATLPDDPYWFAPWAETQVAENLPWATTGARCSSDRFPPDDRFESLAAEYRAERGIRSDARAIAGADENRDGR